LTQEKVDLDALVDDYKQPEKKADDRLTILETRQAEQDQKTANTAAKQEYDTAIGDNVSFIKEGSEIKHSDTVIKGLVKTLAEEDPKFVDAYNNRSKNPDAYKAAQEGLRDKVKEELIIDPSAAKVVQAHLAADGHSNNEPDAGRTREGKTDKEILSMTDQEFEEECASLE